MSSARKSPDRQVATIAAISTPPGSGGIGIIRVSGPLAPVLLGKLFRPAVDRNIIPRHLTYGWITTPGGTPIDEVMAVFLPAPRTYTREDIVEIQCHGSYLVLQKILAELLELGAVAAEPGEFTKRAYLNGRIDLTRAEAVIELLQARTGEGAKLALSQLSGGLHQRLLEIRSELMAMKAIIEVAIDFPEDDVEILDPAAMLGRLKDLVIDPLAFLVKSAERGRIFREGVSVVILGRPNVGKSSLLNSLLREDRAIVTEIPGTTRDVIEEYLDIMGIPVRIVDTAGIRTEAGEVEKIGIARARRKQQEADLVLMMVDGASPLSSDDLAVLGGHDRQSVILVINKIDLAAGRDFSEISAAFGGHRQVLISALTGEGLSDLEEAIYQLVTGASSDLDEARHECVPNVRQQAALLRGLEAARRIETALVGDLPPDLTAIELQTVLDHLGEIIGETTSEDILDMIFEQFCLGK